MLHEIFNWKHIANNQILCWERCKCSPKNWELTAEIANNSFFISKGLAKFHLCFAKVSVQNESSL